MIPVIHDGDHGGDDFITSLLFLSYAEKFKLLGITTVAGNTNSLQAGLNALKAISLANRQDVEVHQGSENPFRIKYRLSDDAFGSDGLGGVDFPTADRAILSKKDAVTWMAEQLGVAIIPVTICATGPLTNIAKLLTEFPELHNKIEQIVIMGGGTEPAGNIKPYAEFNFYMDPDAAHLVLNGPVPVVLHTLNTTQSAVYTSDRQSKLKAALPELLAGKIDSVMRITEDLEKKTFGAEGSFFHDHQVCAFLNMPENYELKFFNARVLCDPETESGRLMLEPVDKGNLRVVTRIKDIDAMFDFILEGLRRITAR